MSGEVFDQLLYNPKLLLWEGEFLVPSVSQYSVRWYFDDLHFWQRDDYQPSKSPLPSKLLVDAGPDGPTETQTRAMQYFWANEKTICRNALTAIVDDARSRYDGFSDFSGSDDQGVLRNQVLAKIDDPGGLRELVSPPNIILLPEDRNGLALVQLDFCTAWDDEHGGRAIMFKDQVVDVE